MADQRGFRAYRRKQRKQQEEQLQSKQSYNYKGYSLDELSKKSISFQISLLNSRARRTYSRGLFGDRKITFDKLIAKSNSIKTHSRDIPILPCFVGQKISVYNGKLFILFEITKEMISHYLGEYSLTRFPPKHVRKGISAKVKSQR